MSKGQTITRNRKRKFFKVLLIYAVACGIGLHIFIAWMALGWPIFFDRWLNVSEKPIQAEAIVCLAGGLAGDNLPTMNGWRRITTAVELCLDGWADTVIFSGGGVGPISEGEVYAKMAGWFGLPSAAVLIDPYANSTAEHPENVLKIEALNIHKGSPLNIVTTPLCARRAYLCFKKAGFANFRMVTGYKAQRRTPVAVRNVRTSQFIDYRPSSKKYDDFLFRLNIRSSYFLEALREVEAIVYYKIKGYI